MNRIEASPCMRTDLDRTEQKGLIVGILHDFASDADTLFKYLAHCEFDVSAINSVDDLQAAWLGHYRIKGGGYDVDRACNHLATWPSIASRIFEFMREKH